MWILGDTLQPIAVSQLTDEKKKAWKSQLKTQNWWDAEQAKNPGILIPVQILSSILTTSSAWTTTGALAAALETVGGSKVIRTRDILFQQVGRCGPSSRLPRIPLRFPLCPTTRLDFTKDGASGRGLCEQLIKSDELCVHKPGGRVPHGGCMP